jgi:protein-S-isoprenylcysteine O-methyltransferase Ste14
MSKIMVFTYGIFSYIIALIGQVWFILYLGEWEFMDRTINTVQTASTGYAIFINIILALLFGLQHSLMARAWFKRWVTQYIPEVVERSTYVLLSGVAFIIVCYYWEPIDGVVWQIESGVWHSFLMGGYIFGWVFSVVATFVINHFELFGLQQVYLHLRNKPTPEIDFTEKLFYKFVRHPIQLGVLIGLWITPVMTYGHLLLSLLFSLYIFIGLYYEEKDLVAELGEVYVEYKKRVGMMIPKRAHNK